jgi:hypothetical protein
VLLESRLLHPSRTTVALRRNWRDFARHRQVRNSRGRRFAAMWANIYVVSEQRGTSLDQYTAGRLGG